ncbi:leucine-rich repeat protein [uncultured Capnocytophaga sp.]|uniref:leucine-rich repeat domain-containing protein n=1 Tax=uncultured Capnocytophaga sp. TaxID=159273 RepID=UPI0025991B91|nr:leucine-rich repeat protein [uncultured Capnocytophaga sp.]
MRKMLWLGVLGCFLLLTAQCTKVIEERIYTQLPANVILSGDGVPALNLGKVGDYYLDVTNTNLYGAKTAEGWGTPISLKGLPGNDGAPGAAGSNGTTPHIGDNGNWFIGKKDTGIKAAGTNGSDGTTPHIGDNGNWFIGNKDTKIKAAGANGKDGLPGKDGSVIYAEAGKPTADKGKQGDYYIDTETKMFYGPKGATNWDLSTGFSLTAQQLSSENYELSSDGKTLLKWKNEKTRFIDMNADPKLRAVEKIGDNAFAPIGSPAKELTTILIGDNVTEIGRAAFNSCYRLKTIDIPEGLTKIGEEAFANCVRLQQIDLPETITSVEKLTFTGCIRLNNIVIPSEVTAIKDRAFLGCTSLSNVFILQETAFVISTTAFDSAKALQNIYVPTNIQNANDKDKFVNQYKALNPTYAAKIR